LRRLTIFVLLAAASLAVPAARADDDDYRNDPKVLACSPKVLKHGGTVTLALGPHHGAEMAVRRTGTSDWYFIVSGGPEKQPLMTPQAFAAAGRVSLDENTMGWGPPKGELMKVFSRKGRYTVYISDKLESEAGGNICTIDYRR
jgi:hypothetical protein